MTQADKQPAMERDPNYWWLRLNYAIRRGDAAEADEAHRRLAALGVEVLIRAPEAFKRQGVAR